MTFRILDELAEDEGEIIEVSPDRIERIIWKADNLEST
jgi:hypothetical protein